MHFDGQGLRLSRGRARLVLAAGPGVASVDHDGRSVLHRGAAGGAGTSRQAGDRQHGSRLAVHRRGLHGRAGSQRRRLDRGQLAEWRVAEVACWAHGRRGFFDEEKGSGSPIAREALEKIGALFDIERPIVGAPAEQRPMSANAWRNRGSTNWRLGSMPSCSASLARVISPAPSAMPARDDRRRRLKISNNAAENAIRPVALGSKNWLFAGSDAGASEPLSSIR
jgi:Transposase IS66 family